MKPANTTYAGLVAAAVLLSGCTVPQAGGSIKDPLTEGNFGFVPYSGGPPQDEARFVLHWAEANETLVPIFEGPGFELDVLQRGKAVLERGGFLQGEFDFIQNLYKLPGDVPVIVQRCDTINAAAGRTDEPLLGYPAGSGVVIVCYEFSWFMEHAMKRIFVDNVTGLGIPEEKAATLAASLTHYGIRSVLYHELGHLFHLAAGLPFTGRAEDVADQFLVWTALQNTTLGDPNSASSITAGDLTVLGGTQFFMALQRMNFGQGAFEQRVSELFSLFAGEHSYDLVRVVNVLCWTYGANPDRLTSLLEPGENLWDPHLPAARAAKCPQEWHLLNDAFQRLMKPFLRTPAELEPANETTTEPGTPSGESGGSGETSTTTASPSETTSASTESSETTTTTTESSNTASTTTQSSPG